MRRLLLHRSERCTRRLRTATLILCIVGGTASAEPNTPDTSLFQHIAWLSSTGMGEGVGDGGLATPLLERYRELVPGLSDFISALEARGDGPSTRSNRDLLEPLNDYLQSTFWGVTLQLQRNPQTGKDDFVFSFKDGATEDLVRIGSNLLVWKEDPYDVPHEIFMESRQFNLVAGITDWFPEVTTGGGCTENWSCTMSTVCTTFSCTSGNCTNVGNCTSQMACTLWTPVNGACTAGSQCTNGPGCTAQNSTCTDGNQCTNGNRCTLGEGCTGLDDLSGCTKGDVCTRNDGCTQGNDCTLSNTGCTQGGHCTEGQSCTSSNGCTNGDWCTMGAVCTNGTMCTIGPTCTGGGGCTAGGQCTKGASCTKGLTCTISSSGACTAGGGGGCTTGAQCTASFWCTNSIGCTAGGVCTVAQCTTSQGCIPLFGQQGQQNQASVGTEPPFLARVATSMLPRTQSAGAIWLGLLCLTLFPERKLRRP